MSGGIDTGYRYKGDTKRKEIYQTPKNLATYCRILASEDKFEGAIDVMNHQPEIIYHLTAGELSRYIVRARIKKVDPTKIIKLKTNIERIINGEEENSHKIIKVDFNPLNKTKERIK